jgi:thioesterase domain-containing protein
MLDTPARKITHLGRRERLELLLQDARREGVGVIRQRLRARADWAQTQLRRHEQAATAEADGAPSFQSQRVGAAFLRALARYQVPKVAVDIALFRPKLDVRYRLGDGRLIDSFRNHVCEDNFWSLYTAGALQVFQVPGNHDNMVLEPNVRVLVALMKRVIDAVAPA